MESDRGVEPYQLKRWLGEIVKKASEDGVEIGEMGSSAPILHQELLDRVVEKRFQKFKVTLRPGFANRRLHFPFLMSEKKEFEIVKLKEIEKPYSNFKEKGRIKRGNRKSKMCSTFSISNYKSNKLPKFLD